MRGTHSRVQAVDCQATGNVSNMITYEEALEIAKSKMSMLNRCDEDDLSYMFGYDSGETTIGGQGICVVLKENGRAINMPYYVMHYHGGKIKKTYSI